MGLDERLAGLRIRALACAVVFGAGCLPTADSERSRLELPLEPVSEGVLPAIVQVDTFEPGLLVAESDLALAMGEGYPDVFGVALAGGPITPCAHALTGDFELDAFEVESERLDVERVGVDGFRLRVHAEGDTEFTLTGRYTPGPQDDACFDLLTQADSIPFRFQVRVRAREVHGVVVQAFVGPSGATCGAEGSALATGSTPMLRAFPADRAGEAIYAANASSARRVGLTLSAGAPGLALNDLLAEEDDGLAALQAPDVATMIEVRPTVGEPLHLEVVDASAITDFAAEFAIFGTSKVDETLVQGETRAYVESSYIMARLVEARVGDAPLCSRPDPRWFRLESDTPRTCEVRPAADAGALASLVRDVIGESLARPLDDGACALRLSAPDMRDGAGFELNVEVELQGR